MTAISILPETPAKPGARFRAVAGLRESTGNTPGEAFDAMNAQLSEEESGALMVIQKSIRPDRFFTAVQQHRLNELFKRWRIARDSGTAFPSEDQAELERLTISELEASGFRAKALLESMQQ